MENDYSIKYFLYFKTDSKAEFILAALLQSSVSRVIQKSNLICCSGNIYKYYKNIPFWKPQNVFVGFIKINIFRISSE